MHSEAGFGEQAVNKIVEIAIASQLQKYELLSLQDFERKGLLLQIQQLDVTQGKLTLQATAHIEQFPSS